MQALEVPMRVGVKQGIMQGITVGTTNCVFLCSYALAFWYGSTRVRASKYDGRPLPAYIPLKKHLNANAVCMQGSRAQNAEGACIAVEDYPLKCLHGRRRQDD